MKPSARLRVPKDVVIQQLGVELVLLNLQTGVYWNLNETGAMIWNEIREHGSAASAAAALRARFATTPDEASSAVEALVNDLLREGLLERKP